MNRADAVLLVAVDAHPSAVDVVRAADSIARVIGADVELLHVRESTRRMRAVESRFEGRPLTTVAGAPVEQIVEASASGPVVMVAVCARREEPGVRPAGHVALGVLERVGKPVVVVPPSTSGAPRSVRRALVPLEGSPPTSESIDATMCSLARGGVELIPFHVLESDSIPACWDEPAHAHESFSTSFTGRWCMPAHSSLVLHRGTAVDDVVATAVDIDADIIVLAWSRIFAAGRAPVVRAVLSRSPVPVLLVPVPDGPTADGV